MIKAILFDFFDVIHRDHQKAWLAANGYVRQGGFAEASDLLDRGMIDFDEYLTRYAECSGRTSEVVRQEFAAFDKVDEDVTQLITQLKQHYKTGLISNAHSSELRPILETYDLERLFDEITISSEVGVAKPDANIFRHVMSKLAVMPAECVFIDDNAINVAAAEALGVTGIVFTEAFKLTADLRALSLLK